MNSVIVKISEMGTGICPAGSLQWSHSPFTISVAREDVVAL